MTLKQAILALPKLDKRWEEYGGSVYYGSRFHICPTRAAYCNRMEAFHAAAKTIGYEIWWTPELWRVGRGLELGKPPFCAHWCYPIKAGHRQVSLDKYYKSSGVHKTPALAIRAAFIAAVQDAKKRKEDKP